MRWLRAILLLVMTGGFFGCAIAKQDLIDWGKGLATDAAAQAAKAGEDAATKQAASYTTQAQQAKDSGDQLHYLLYTTLATALLGGAKLAHQVSSTKQIVEAVTPVEEKKA